MRKPRLTQGLDVEIARYASQSYLTGESFRAGPTTTILISREKFKRTLDVLPHKFVKLGVFFQPSGFVRIEPKWQALYVNLDCAVIIDGGYHLGDCSVPDGTVMEFQSIFKDGIPLARTLQYLNLPNPKKD